MVSNSPAQMHELGISMHEWNGGIWRVGRRFEPSLAKNAANSCSFFLALMFVVRANGKHIFHRADEITQASNMESSTVTLNYRQRLSETTTKEHNFTARIKVISILIRCVDTDFLDIFLFAFCFVYSQIPMLTPSIFDQVAN